MRSWLTADIHEPCWWRSDWKASLANTFYVAREKERWIGVTIMLPNSSVMKLENNRMCLEKKVDSIWGRWCGTRDMGRLSLLGSLGRMAYEVMTKRSVVLWYAAWKVCCCETGLGKDGHVLQVSLALRRAS